jgi:hypothetical protein
MIKISSSSAINPKDYRFSDKCTKLKIKVIQAWDTHCSTDRSIRHVRIFCYTSNMPYILKEDRPPIDELLQPLIDYLAKQPLEKQDGDVNYSVTKLLKALYTPKYFNFNRAMGVLSSIQAEWYRHDVAPYEDTKIQENGDVE